MFLWSQNVFGQIFSNFTEIVPLGPLCGRTLRPPIGINVECPTYPFHVGSESTFEGPSRFNAPARFMQRIEIGEFGSNPIPAFQISNLDANGQTTTIFKTNRWGGRFVWERNDSQEPQVKIVEFGGATNDNHYFRLFDEINNDYPVTEFNTRGTSFIGTKLRIGLGWGAEGSYTLAVGGKIGAKEEVRVFLSNVYTFPDYVFEPNYPLPSLLDIEKFIKTYKHLPEVPTAKEIEKEGMSLNGMNIILLKKVEELTLYTIEQEKRIKALEIENAKLKNLEKRIQALEAKNP